MRNDLTCAVVRDLLPNYVEGLTSEETGQAVERHLRSCPDCAAKQAAMVGPELASRLEEERKVRHHRRRKAKPAPPLHPLEVVQLLALLPGLRRETGGHGGS